MGRRLRRIAERATRTRKRESVVVFEPGSRALRRRLAAKQAGGRRQKRRVTRAAGAYDELSSVLGRTLDGAEAEDWDFAHAAAAEVEDFDLEVQRTILPQASLARGSGQGLG